MRELSNKVSAIHTEIVKEKEVLYEKRKFHNSDDAAEFAASFFEGADREKIYVCCVDNHNKPISMELASVGTVSETVTGVREVFKSAILSNAMGIFMFHNHLSGETQPSMEDCRITDRMKEAGFLLGIPLIDHIVIGEAGKYYSFRENDW